MFDISVIRKSIISQTQIKKKINKHTNVTQSIEYTVVIMDGLKIWK